MFNVFKITKLEISNFCPVFTGFDKLLPYDLK